MIYNKISEIFKKGQSPYDTLDLQELSIDETLLTASMSFGLTKDVNRLITDTLPLKASVNESGLHELKRASLLIDQLHLSGHVTDLNSNNINRISSIIAKGVAELAKGEGETCSKNLPAIAYLSRLNEAMEDVAAQSSMAHQVNTLFSRFLRNQTTYLHSDHQQTALSNSLNDLVNEINTPRAGVAHEAPLIPDTDAHDKEPLSSELLANDPNLLSERASEINARLLNSAVYQNSDLFPLLNNEQVGMLHPSLVEELIITAPEQLAHVDAHQQTISMSESAVRADANTITSVKFGTDRLLDASTGQMEANYRVLDALEADHQERPLSSTAINKVLSIGVQLSKELNQLGSQFYSSMARPMAAFDTGLQDPPRTMHYVDAMLTKINQVTHAQYLTPEQYRIADKLKTVQASFHRAIDRPSTLSAYVKENGNLMRETLERNNLIRTAQKGKDADETFDFISGYEKGHKPILTQAYVQDNPEVIASPEMVESSRLRFIQAQGSLIQYATAAQQTPELQVEAIRSGADLNHLKLDLRPSQMLKDGAKNLRHIEDVMKAKTSQLKEAEIPVIEKIARSTLSASEHAMKGNKADLTHAEPTKKTPVQVIRSIGNEVERLTQNRHDFEAEQSGVIGKIKKAFSHMVNKWFSKDKETSKALDHITVSHEEYTEHHKEAISYGREKSETISLNTSVLGNLVKNKSSLDTRKYDEIEFKR